MQLKELRQIREGLCLQGICELNIIKTINLQKYYA